MSTRHQIETITEELLDPILAEKKFELVDIEYVKEAGNYYLRVYIDKEGGITIDDCEIVSRELGSLLDEKDPIKDPYILEVSSPGLDRPLKKEKDFKRSLGKTVELKLYQAINGTKEFEGILEDYNKDQITVQVDGENMTFQRNDIAIIRLAVIF